MKGSVVGCLAGALIAVLAGVPLFASSGGNAATRVFASILPQEYMVERIGGDLVDVRALVGQGQDPHTFEPTPAQMTALARADAFLTVGVPFEKVLMPKIRRLFPGLKIVDTTQGVGMRYFSPDHREGGRASHTDHGYGGQAPDPHVWLDPKRVKIMAANIASSLGALDPAHAETFQRNLEGFRADLDDLDAEITRILEPVKGRKIYVFHPAFGYFCESYGLEQEAFEIAGKEPGARQLAELIKSARDEGVRVIFVQPQFSAKAAQAIADSIGGAVVPIDPLPRDYLRGMRSLAEKVRGAYADKGEAPGSGKEAAGNAG